MSSVLTWDMLVKLQGVLPDCVTESMVFPLSDFAAREVRQVMNPWSSGAAAVAALDRQARGIPLTLGGLPVGVMT